MDGIGSIHGMGWGDWMDGWDELMDCDWMGGWYGILGWMR